jgi:hypothetical protein
MIMGVLVGKKAPDFTAAAVIVILFLQRQKVKKQLYFFTL